MNVSVASIARVILKCPRIILLILGVPSGDSLNSRFRILQPWSSSLSFLNAWVYDRFFSHAVFNYQVIGLGDSDASFVKHNVKYDFPKRVVSLWLRNALSCVRFDLGYLYLDLSTTDLKFLAECLHVCFLYQRYCVGVLLVSRQYRNALLE